MKPTILHVSCTFALIIALPGSSAAQNDNETLEEDEGDIERLSLDELQERALAHYPEIEAARARIERLEAQLDEVRWQPFSGIRVRGTLAPMPERVGDALHFAQGDLVYFNIPWGVLIRTQLDVNIPIYTFGRLKAERDAVLADIVEGRENVRSKRRQVVSKVQRAYYALQLSQQSLSLLEEGQGYLSRAQRYIERNLEEDVGDITESDRLRVEVLAAEVEARLSDARRGKRLATAALKMLAGLSEDEDADTPPLDPLDLDLGRIQQHLDAASEARPELAAAEARTAALRARERGARARFLPEIRLVGNLDHSYSNVADDQMSPFVYDPFNHLRFQFGLTLRWDIDFMSDRARFHQAEARVREAESEEEAIRAQVALEVEEVYIEVDENQHVVDARRRGRRASRGWLFSIMQGIDVGVLEPPELVDALRAYFEQSFLYYEAVMRLNASIGQMDLVVGAGDGGDVNE